MQGIKCRKTMGSIMVMLCFIGPYNNAVGEELSVTVDTPQGLFETYQQNRQLNLPNYITTDLWLAAYSLVRQRTLTETENNLIRPLLQSLLKELSDTVANHSKDAAGDANRSYLAVLNALWVGDIQAPSKTAQRELDLVLEAKTIASSPLWGYAIDYSQFKPRGRYTQSPESERYFRTLRYASGILFAITPSQATGVDQAMVDRMTLQASRLTESLQTAQSPYAQLESLLAWQMGNADDLTTADILRVKKEVKDDTSAAFQIGLRDFAKKQRKQPRILSGLVDASKLEENLTAADVLTGWRLIPLRFSVDSAVFQQLVYTGTGVYKGSCQDCPIPFGLTLIEGKPVKGFPSAREIMALLGSQAAAQWITTDREDQFEGYPVATEKAGGILSGATGLNSAQLDLIKARLTQPANGQDSANDRLTSMLAFWTWQRYINVLYSKQSYTMTGKGFAFDSPRPGAWLEPARALYQALAKIVEQHRKMTPSPAWDRFAKLLSQAIEVNAKIDQGKELDSKDESYLNNLDKALLAVTGAKDLPIVVDVHTNPASGEVLEEGIGYSRSVEKDKARGARMTHYEFKQPLKERLTDAAWRQRLAKKDKPE